MEACPKSQAVPRLTWASEGRTAAGHWESDEKLSSKRLEAMLDNWLPTAFEVHVLPRLRDLLCEVLDDRLPLPEQSVQLTTAPSKPEAGPDTQDSKAINLSLGSERKQSIVPFQSSNAMCISGSAVARPSETSCMSLPVLVEDNATSTCGGGVWVLHPNSRARWIWDSAALAVFVVDIIYTTFEWAFVSSGPVSERSAGLVIADTLTGMFWTGDVAMNFCTGYLNSSTCLVEMNQRKVARHYLCTWFVIDCVATVQPLFAIFVQSVQGDGDMESAKLLSLFKVLKLTKLLRVAKLSVLRRRLAQLETRTQSKVLICVLCIAQLLGVLLTASHVFACLLWFVGQQSVQSGNVDESWVGSRPQIDLVNSPSRFRQYMASMHLSVSIMTGMGTGSWSTALLGEELLLCSFYLVSLSLVGVIVNEVAAMYSKMSESSAEITHAITGASSFMNWYKVPPSLQVRIERYLQNVFDHKEHTDFREQLNQWLQASGGLLSELNLAIFGCYLTTHPQIKLLPRELISVVANVCESNFFPPGEVILKPNTKPHRVLWMRSGMMEVVAAGTHGRLKGQVFKPGITAAGTPVPGYAHGQAELLGEGDMLFHRNLLLPNAERSRCTCTCTSFCEVMSLEYSTFKAELNRRCPDHLPVLRAHAAIQEDSVELLSWALGKDPTQFERKMLCGETLLHVCVEEGAQACIRWLLTSGWRSDIRDSSGRTALDVAKSLKRKALVDAIVLGGGKVAIRSAVPARRLRRFKATPTDSRLVAASVEDLAQGLSSAGVDVARFGQGGAKSLCELYEEIKEGFGGLVIAADGKVKRVLHVARVRVAATFRGHEKLLSETEEERWFNSGVHVVKLPMKKMRGAGAESLDEALETLWSRYIGLGPKFVSRHFERGVESLFEEAKSTGSYPGLDCIYRIHEVPYWVRNQTNEACACIGLPHGDVFKVQETFIDGRTKTHVFTWLEQQQEPVAEATKELSTRLGASKLRLSETQLHDLAQEEMGGACCCLEDLDGEMVCVVSQVRFRITAAGCAKGPKVLHEAHRSRPCLPAGAMLSGHLERAIGKLWQRLLARDGGFSLGHYGETLKVIEKHFRRGIITTHEEHFKESGCFSGLRCLRLTYEVSYVLRELQAKTACSSLGLPLPDGTWTPVQQGLLWLPDSEDTEVGPACL